MTESGRRPLLARWRPALRLARRDIRRSPGRTALIVALIALPIFAVSAVDVLVRSVQLSAVQKADRKLAAADAVITFQHARVEQSPDGESVSFLTDDGSIPENVGSTSGVLAALPRSSTVLADNQIGWVFRTRYGVSMNTVSDLDVTAAAVRRSVRVESGRTASRPDEMTITPEVARLTGMRIGDRVSTIPRTSDTAGIGLENPVRPLTLTVVGVVSARWDPDDQTVRIAPGTLAGRLPAVSREHVTTTWYASVPGGLSWLQVTALNAQGLAAVSRQVAHDPPPRSAVPYYVHNDPRSGSQKATVSGAVIVVGLIVLEIVLLAGPAFAVGARRSRRALALVGAAGGTRSDLRRIVLSSAILIGVIAGVLGVLGGILAGAALLPTLGRWRSIVPGPLDLRPLELGAVIALSVVTALLAAWAPAHSASRTDVLTALRGRRERRRPRRWIPVAGLVIAGAGAVIAVAGGVVLVRPEVVLGGAVMAQAGLILITPSLLGLLGRLAPLSPPTGRIALRDTARNRSAVAPAVAAIMAAVTGTVGITTIAASLMSHDRRAYVPSLPNGYVNVSGSAVQGDEAQIVADLKRAAGAGVVARVRTVTEPADIGKSTNVTALGYTLHGTAPRSNGALPAVMVGDEHDLPVIAGRSDPAAEAALRSGKAVVFDAGFLHNGLATVTYDWVDAKGTTRHRSFTAQAVSMHSTYPSQSVVVPASVARRWGLSVIGTGWLAATNAVPDAKQQQAIDAAAAHHNLIAEVERGYQEQYQLGLLILLVAAVVVTLGAATIATGLSAVDSRPDVATLVAVGASPSVRRRLSAARAGTIATSGSVLGVAAGLVAPAGYLLLLGRSTGQTGYSLVVPWLNIVIALVVVPLLAVLGAFAFSRSRLPVERLRAN